jgi:hypothetical protein
VVAEESFERTYLAGFHESYRNAPWMFGLSFNDMRNERWKALICSMQERSGDNPLGRMLAEKNNA